MAEASAAPMFARMNTDLTTPSPRDGRTSSKDAPFSGALRDDLGRTLWEGARLQIVPRRR